MLPYRWEFSFFGLYVNCIGKEPVNSRAVEYVKVGHGWAPSEYFANAYPPVGLGFDGLSLNLIRALRYLVLSW